MEPQKPSPAEVARVQANVAKMRAAGAPESDVVAYLQHEDSLSSQAPAPNTDLSFRNLGRSFVQGGTFGWGDELGLTSREGAAAFKAEHPIADFIAKLAGGAVAPAVAVATLPGAATLGGAAAIGAGAGMLSGAGEAEGSAMDRVKGGAVGGLLGGGLGVAGYGAGKVLGATGSAVLDRMHPERAVTRAASGVMTPNVASELAKVEAIAPGGASVATAAPSRFTRMLHGVGASAEAGAKADANFGAQKAALETARKSIGSQMDQIKGTVPADQTILSQVSDILGAKAPKPAGATLDVQEARDALSRLRYIERQTAKRGPNANSAQLSDIREARVALQDHIAQHVPGFDDLDKQYAIVSDHLRRTDQAIKTVEQSRANYAATKAFGATPGSVGATIPHSTRGVVADLLDHLLTDREGAARAVTQYLTRSGGASVANPLMVKPSPSVMPKLGLLTGAALAPRIRGLLSPSP